MSRLDEWGAVASLSLVLATLPVAVHARQEAVHSEALAEPKPVEVSLGKLVEGIACLRDPTQTYTLYLPSTYSVESPGPVLLIFDPRGRSAMAAEIFRQGAEDYGWILMSSDNTRSDGPWEPNFKALRAMAPDILRYAHDSDRIYATGFSGGAMLAWLWAARSGQVAGVISSGGRPLEETRFNTDVGFAHFGAAGEAEFNYLPTLELDRIAERSGAPHRFEAFPGPHAWMPPDLAVEAIEWMELQAMRSGTRAVDATLVAELYAKDLAAGRRLEKSGDPLAALRRYQAIARTFDGLREAPEALTRAAELESSDPVTRALRLEADAHRYEAAQRHQMGRALSLFQPAPETESTGVMSVGDLERELRLGSLLKRAEQDTALGLAARRVLNSMAAQLGFYLPREYFETSDYARAAVALELAARIGPARSFVFYNLAAANARLRRRKRAVEALERAVEAGYSNADYLEQDEDFDNLRQLGTYRALVERMRQAAEDCD